MRITMFLKTAAIMSIIVAIKLSAHTYQTYFYWDDCNQLSVYGEALYWKPASCAVQWGEDRSSRLPKKLGISNDYQWGFRVGVDLTMNCFLTKLSYLCFRPSDSSRVTGEEIRVLDTNGSPVTAHLRTTYQNVDFLAGQYLTRCEGCEFYIYGNIRWVDLTFRHRLDVTRANSGPISYELSSKFGGAGVGIGVGGGVEICGGLGFVGHCGLMGILGDVCLEKQLEVQENVSGFQPYKNVTIVPEAEFSLGLNYTYQCGYWNIIGEVGYELHYYLQALMFTTIVQNVNADPYEFQCNNIGFGGLYLKLGVGF